MTATQELISEHDAVLVALRLLEEVEIALTAKSAEASGHLEQLLEFFKGFVDRCHHGKEEDALFPELERRGVPRDGGPIGVMLAEHEAGRGHVRALAAALEQWRQGKADAVGLIQAQSLAYRELLQAHIAKENNVLFPLADRLLPEDAARNLVERFAEIERERVGAGRHEAYHALLGNLKEIYGLS